MPGLGDVPGARCRHLAPEFSGARCSVSGDMYSDIILYKVHIVHWEKSAKHHLFTPVFYQSNVILLPMYITYKVSTSNNIVLNKYKKKCVLL